MLLLALKKDFFNSLSLKNHNGVAAWSICLLSHLGVEGSIPGHVRQQASSLNEHVCL